LGGLKRGGSRGGEMEHNNTEHHGTYMLDNLEYRYFIWGAGVTVNFGGGGFHLMNNERLGPDLVRVFPIVIEYK